MQIDLPQDVIDRVRRRAGENIGLTEADVIRKALDSLEWQESERLAIQEGIDAMNSGHIRSFNDFDREFRHRYGIGDSD
jgi:hypothetical protein